MIKRKKEDKKKLYMALFIVFLMVSSGLALWKGGTEEQNVTFSDGKYWIKVDDSYFSFDYLEEDVKDIDMDVYDVFQNKVILTGVVTEDVLTKMEKIFIFKGVLPVRGNITDCDSEDVILLFNGGEEERIFMSESCVVLEGDMFKVSDRLGYWLLENE